MAGESPLSFGTTTSLSATTSTGNAALPTLTSNQIAVTNLGPDLAYVKFGTDNTVTATTAAYPLLPGEQIIFTISPSLTYGAAICPTSTATIKFTAADGYISGVAAASTGASGGTVDSVNVAQWGGTATTLGQKAMTASVPVVVASDQSAVPTSNATQLPASLGQKAMAASLPVVLASDQSTISDNLAQVAGTTTATGHGVSGAGVLRVELPTDGTGTIANITTSVVPGTAATNLGKAEDAVHTSGDVGVMALGVATDGTTTLNAAGDYSVLGTDTAGNVRVVGNVADNVAESGNPVAVGGLVASSAANLTAGRRGELRIGVGGGILTSLIGVVAADGASNSSIGVSSSLGSGSVIPQNANMAYNGTTWDRVRSGGVTGMLGVSPQATPSGAASFLNIAAGQATTTVKSGAGTLYAIVLNSAAVATNTTTVYDNTAASGTVIARPAATTATVPTTLNYGSTGLAFATGLTIITATANGSDMTVIYK